MREVGGPAVLAIVQLLPFVVFLLGFLRRYTVVGCFALSFGALMLSVNVWYLAAHVWLHGAVDWGETWPMWAAAMGAAIIVAAVLGVERGMTSRLLYLGGLVLMAPVVPQMMFFFPGAIFFVPLGFGLLIFMTLFNPRLRLLACEKIV